MPSLRLSFPATVISLAVSIFVLAPASAAARECESGAGTLIASEGAVQYREAAEWQDAEPGLALCQRDAVRTGANSRAAVRLLDDAVLRLDENTTLVLSDVAPEPEQPSLLQLVFGAIESFSRRPQTLEVDTPYLNATIEGTEFALRVGPAASALTVLEGTVRAANEYGTASVTSGSSVVAEQGSAPRSVVLAEPRDAVEWALYYPPVLTGQALGADPLVAQAQALDAANRPDQAIALLQSQGAASADARLYLASLLLSVGRVQEAAQVIDGVLAADPGNGIALAESAVIDVATNDRDSALEKAERAVAATPDRAAPYVALSYAQQAHFRLEDARDTLLAGAERVPDSALIQARLSEIWLALGYRDRALAAADRALEIDPNLGRAYVMRGYASLTAYKTVPAAQAFERAIALDPADPYPRLGLGLAKIREGEIEAGRSEIDAAVALDANRSLYRSYLGKAYFAEDRNPLAAQQFEIAKQLDPSDPTPYLYDAIRLQTENRPGEALLAIQESIARNDNRAVYRGQLLLDKDEAARGASLGRIYQDLGFTYLGQRVATESLALDPANSAAHRFLADLYRGERRRELARVSELTRAQLLQDVNLNPVQPSLTETNLNLVSQGGPTDPGFNEFTSLFASDGFRFTGSGTFGTDDTWGGEMGFAVQDDNVSISVSGFEFRTDGFRENFDVRHSIYDVFGQMAVTPTLTLQAEVRNRITANGDLDLNFDPDNFDPTLHEEFEEFSARLGARFAPNPNNTTLASLIYAQRNASEEFLASPPFFFGTTIDGDAVQAELQHIFQTDFFSLTAGGSYSESDDDFRAFLTADGIPTIDLAERPLDSSDYRLYGYGSFHLPFNLTVTAGLSYSNFENGPVEVEEINPKAGVEWRPLDDITVRAAYTKTVKPPLATNRTIEPTQVAGFNQYFDDSNGTVSERYGVGIDWAVTPKVFVGAEATWRSLEVPFLGFSGEPLFADHDEQTHRVYLNALPHPRLPVSLEVVYDKFEAEESLLTTDVFSPTPFELQTISVPLTVRYFDPSGLFVGARATYVNQKVERASDNIFLSGESEFAVIDADIGYRFPNQRGSVSLSARNLLDSDFEFQDDGFREFGSDPSTGPYFPGISVLGRLTVNF